MKKIICLLLLSSFSAMAGVVCVNPTTRFYLTKELTGYQLVVASPYGTKFTPVYDGQVSPVMLQQIEDSGEILESLGENLKITFTDSSCLQNEALVSCFEGTMDNPRVGKIRFYTTSISEKSLQDNYDLLRLSLVLMVDGEQYQISSRYDPKTCSFL